MEAVDDCGPCGEIPTTFISGDTVGKVVISGASGLLGRAIHKELFLNGYPHIEAVGLANTRWKPDAGLRKCDLTDFEELE